MRALARHVAASLLLAVLGGFAADAATADPILYDQEYPVVGYGGEATHNAIARLQQRLARGELQLEYRAPRGYLDGMLQALGIDPSSQVLVYSKTSLQAVHISGAKPRAIFFNDHTYVALVQDSTLLEIATMDSALGPVFYTLDNRAEIRPQASRELSRCLVCHDSFSLMRGGTPQFIVNSLRVDVNGLPLPNEVAERITDESPLESRWGGWYVSGRPAQPHLGNIQVKDAVSYLREEKKRRADVDDLRQLLDVRPYPTDKSDVVALLVLEHQQHVQNLIARANFKARKLLASNDAGADTSWEALPAKVQGRVGKLAESLVEAMLLTGEAPLAGPTRGTSGFDAWFQRQGPRDVRGRSLRDLDLTSRLFRHRLSYMVYSEAFAGLPASVRERVYARFAGILSAKDAEEPYTQLGRSERATIAEILGDTSPEFAAALERATGRSAASGG